MCNEIGCAFHVPCTSKFANLLNTKVAISDGKIQGKFLGRRPHTGDLYGSGVGENLLNLGEPGAPLGSIVAVSSLPVRVSYSSPAAYRVVTSKKYFVPFISSNLVIDPVFPETKLGYGLLLASAV